MSTLQIWGRCPAITVILNDELSDRRSNDMAAMPAFRKLFDALAPILGLLCLAVVWPKLGHAEFITHPLDQAPPAQPAQTSETPSPQTPPPVQPSQTDMQAQFGTKKLGTCSMTYKLEGFSLAYKQYDGSGEISCRNGEKAKVLLSSKSIGFTIGYSSIEGEGYFTDVKYLSEIYGDYISLGNHFGFKNSIDRQVLTRGEISLVLIGKGQGFDIGFTIGDLSIKPK